MRIAVLGGTGKTGRAFLRQALAGGHSLRVLARTPAALVLEPGLEVVRGDARDAAALAKLVAGTDALASFLGHVRDSPVRLQADSMAALLTVLGKEGPRRVVCLTGAGVPDPADPSQPLLTKMETAVLEKLSPGRVSDGIAQTDLLRQSGLQWTVVRSPVMLAGPASGKIRTGYFAMGPLDWIRREDVAGFVLECLEKESWVGQCPMLRH
jgi:uncharacterized protein YbjT (DUF2867 family)